MTDRRLLVVGRDGVSLAEPGEPGALWNRRPLVERGRWPAWNPVFDVMAVSVETNGRSELRVVDFEGHTERVLFASPEGVAPVIAPRVPHYPMWSPGGNVLSYVAQSTYGLTLFLSHLEGTFGPDAIINGAPLFSAWCTDNNFLAVHAGEELAVVEVEGSRTTAEISQRALGFRTPAYSDDAEVLAYALPEDGGAVIMKAKFQGTGGVEVARFAGGVALGFRPGTQELTVAMTADPSTGGFDELWSIDLGRDGAPSRKLARGPFVSFLWAPTADRLAVVAPAFSGDGRYVIRSLSPEGKAIAASEPFLPSEDYRIYLAFFDQYANSHSLWTPDGSTLIVGGRLPGDGVSPSFGDPEPSYVMTWAAERGAAFETVAAGEIAFCAPLPKQIH